MKIAVTGAAGKLGLWVVRDLLSDDSGQTAHEVRALDRFPSADLGAAEYRTFDHEDYDQVLEALAGTEAVIHLSAIPRPGLISDRETFRINVMGTYNVHEAAARLGIRRVVTASSNAITGWTYAEGDFRLDYLPIDEAHPNRPQDAYGLSKEASEAIARSFTEKTGMETVAIRPGWVVDPDELERLRVNGGRPERRFYHYTYVDVRDVAQAFRLSVERRLPGHNVFYIVADDSSVAEPLAELFPQHSSLVGTMAAGLTGTRAAISNERAKRVLGWSPRYGWRS